MSNTWENFLMAGLMRKNLDLEIAKKHLDDINFKFSSLKELNKLVFHDINPFVALNFPPGFRQNFISEDDLLTTPNTIITHFHVDAGDYGLRYFNDIKSAGLAIICTYNIPYEEDEDGPTLTEGDVNLIHKIELLDAWAKLNSDYIRACEILNSLIKNEGYESASFIKTVAEYVDTYNLGFDGKEPCCYQTDIYFWNKDIEKEAIEIFDLFPHHPLCRPNCDDNDQWKWVLSHLKPSQELF